MATGKRRAESTREERKPGTSDLGEVSFVSIGSFLVTGCRISTRLEEPTGQGWTKFG